MNEFQQDSCCAVPIFNHALKREKKPENNVEQSEEKTDKLL